MERFMVRSGRDLTALLTFMLLGEKRDTYIGRRLMHVLVYPQRSANLTRNRSVKYFRRVSWPSYPSTCARGSPNCSL